jgi:hypothetical protein
MSIEAMNVASQCRATASSQLAQSILVDGGNAFLSDLLLCAARVIEAAEQAQPVATMWQHGETGRTRISTPDSITDCDARWFKVSDLYTAPPPRQPMTDEEIESLWDNTLSEDVGITALRKIVRAIEAAHGIKEKNTRQDGNCKHCVNGCSACDARRQPNVLF